MISISELKRERKEEKELFIDLNADLAQSFGAYKNPSEQELLPYVSSVNIACGLHAGDPLAIMDALKVARDKNLSIGAHIGYPDIQGFGCRAMQLDEDELKAMVIYQIGAVSSMAKAFGVQVDFVRPHGALYQQAAEDFNVSVGIAKAIAEYNPWLIYVGAVSDNLIKAGEAAQIRIAAEAHLDKKYKPDGTIDFDAQEEVSFDQSLQQLNLLVNNSTIKNNIGGVSKVDFCTIHLNMKSKHSLEIAKRAKALIKKPVPISVSVVKDTSWF